MTKAKDLKVQHLICMANISLYLLIDELLKNRKIMWSPYFYFVDALPVSDITEV